MNRLIPAALACLLLTGPATAQDLNGSRPSASASPRLAPPSASSGIQLPWTGTIYTTDAKPLKGTVEKITPEGTLRLISAGTAYQFTLEQLHPITRGELRIGTPADTQAYLADLPRRQQHAAQELAKHHAESIARQQTAQATLDRLQAQRQAKAEADARILQQRHLDALETLAREAELRRFQGR